MEMVDRVAPLDREHAIKAITKLDWIKMKHKAIQNWLKSRNAPLIFVVDTNGTRKTDLEMIESIV